MAPVHQGALRVARVDEDDAVLRRDGDAERQGAAHGEKRAHRARCAEEQRRLAGAQVDALHFRSRRGAPQDARVGTKLGAVQRRSALLRTVRPQRRLPRRAPARRARVAASRAEANRMRALPPAIGRAPLDDAAARARRGGGGGGGALCVARQDDGAPRAAAVVRICTHVQRVGAIELHRGDRAEGVRRRCIDGEARHAGARAGPE